MDPKGVINYDWVVIIYDYPVINYDPSLDHFWRVLFGHFPKTVVKFIQKAPTKSTSNMVPMANSLAFWWRAGTTSTLHSDPRLPFQDLPPGTDFQSLTSRVSGVPHGASPTSSLGIPHEGVSAEMAQCPSTHCTSEEPSAQTSPAHFAEELFSHHASRAQFSYTRKS